MDSNINTNSHTNIDITNITENVTENVTENENLFFEKINFNELCINSQSSNSVFCSPIENVNNFDFQNLLFVDLKSDMCVEKCNVLLESIKEIDKNNNFSDNLSVDDISNIVSSYDFEKLKNFSLELYKALSQIKELRYDLEKNTIDRLPMPIDEKKEITKKMSRNRSFCYNNNENICGKNISNYTILEKKYNIRDKNNIYLSMDKKTNRKYTIRIISSPNFILHKASFNLLSSTVENMKQIDYENILKLHDVIEDKKEKKIYLVTRHVDEKILLEKDISSTKFTVLSMDKVIDYTKQIINGLLMLHSQNIIYGNFGLDNIILSDSDQIYLTDFWINNAAQNKYIVSNKHKIETLLFTPPELLLKNVSCGFFNNVWSLGVIIFIMIFGYYPFYDEKYEELKNKILHGNPEYPKNITEIQRDFFKKIFNKEPPLRITLSQILRHNLFGEYKRSSSFSSNNNLSPIFIAKPPLFNNSFSSSSSFKRKLSNDGGFSFDNNLSPIFIAKPPSFNNSFSSSSSFRATRI